jgi:hypothetical protein
MFGSFHVNQNISGSSVLEKSFEDFSYINTCNRDFLLLTTLPPSST